MVASKTNDKLLYADLTFVLNGIAIEVRKEIGRFGKEKQYCDLYEAKLKDKNISYRRELKIGDSGNTVDFNIEDKLLLEMKAKPFVLKEDYYQTQRYLQVTQLELDIIYNFREQYVKPHRILRTIKIP